MMRLIFAFAFAAMLFVAATPGGALAQKKQKTKTPPPVDPHAMTVSGYLVDRTCARDGEEAPAPEEVEDIVEEARNHLVSCAVSEEHMEGGFAVVSSKDGVTYKFDAAGDKLAASLLLRTRRKIGMGVTVEGVLAEDGVLRVTKITESSGEQTVGV